MTKFATLAGSSHGLSTRSAGLGCWEERPRPRERTRLPTRSTAPGMRAQVAGAAQGTGQGVQTLKRPWTAACSAALVSTRLWSTCPHTVRERAFPGTPIHSSKVVKTSWLGRRNPASRKSALRRPRRPELGASRTLGRKYSQSQDETPSASI